MAMDELGLPERGAGNEKDWVREKDEAKTKVSDQGSKFNYQLCIYIGRARRFVSAGLSCKVSSLASYLIPGHSPISTSKTVSHYSS